MATRLLLRLWLAVWLVLVAAGASAQPAPRIAAGVEAVGMTVADMDRSISVYSTVLGFEKVSDVEVAGSDDERLLGVFGARLRITTLRAGGAPKVELLEYLAPRRWPRASGPGAPRSYRRARSGSGIGRSASAWGSP